jgi:hypothetical protein
MLARIGLRDVLLEASAIPHDRPDHRWSDAHWTRDFVHQPQLSDLLRITITLHDTFAAETFRDPLESHPPDRQAQQPIHRARRLRKRLEQLTHQRHLLWQAGRELLIHINAQGFGLRESSSPADR